MNKSLFVLMAVCLLSVHAFVKRDAEKPAEKNYVEDFSKQFEEFTKSIQGQLKETFDPEKLKAGFNKIVGDVEKSLKSLETKPAEAPKS